MAQSAERATVQLNLTVHLRSRLAPARRVFPLPELLRAAYLHLTYRDDFAVRDRASHAMIILTKT